MNSDNTSSQPSPYLAYYGMTREPFSAIIEDDLFYPEPNRKQRLEILLHLTQYGNECLLVNGPPGSGKTTLLQKLQQQAMDSWSIARIEAVGGLDERQFLQQLFHQLNLDFQGATKNDLHEKLLQYFENLQRSARQGVIVIDDAEQLHIVTLKNILAMAAHTNADDKPVLRVILFGTNELMTLFKDPQLGHLANLPQRALDLPPFDKEHTAHYVLHRLSAANFSDNKPFTDAALNKIYKQSKGWPGRINELAHKVLINSVASRPTKAKTSQPVSRPLRNLSLAAIIAVITGVLFFQDDINRWFESNPQGNETPLAVTEKLIIPDKRDASPTDTTAPESTPMASVMPAEEPKPTEEKNTVTASDPFSMNSEPASESATADIDAVADDNTIDIADSATEILSAPSSQTNNTSEQQPLAVPTEHSPGEEMDTTQAVAKTGDDHTASPEAEPDMTQTESVDLATPVTDPPMTEITTPTVETHESDPAPANIVETESSQPESAPDSKAESPPSAAPVQNETPLPSQATMPPAQTAVIEKPGIKAPSTDPSLDLPTQQNDWLLQQDPTHFTLQLVAGNNIRTIRRFIREHSLEGDIAFYQTTLNGKPWHGLVLGNFPNKQAAIDARSHLPEQLRSQKPWIRNLGSIQQSLPKP